MTILKEHCPAVVLPVPHDAVVPFTAPLGNLGLRLVARQDLFPRRPGRAVVVGVGDAAGLPGDPLVVERVPVVLGVVEADQIAAPLSGDSIDSGRFLGHFSVRPLIGPVFALLN